MYYIYKIENLINHKIYIGLTNNPVRRRIRHFSDLKGKRHDNSFLQKEYLKHDEKNFDFQIIYESDCTSEEISIKEEYYIQFYDSYFNGYNQNQGGNFKPSNGGSHLIKSDIFCILSALEFISKPGQILANMFDVSRTTISRINRGENHLEIIQEYKNLPLKERKEIFQIFCDSTTFYEDKVNTTIIKSKRKLNETDVHLVLYNEENNRKISLERLAKSMNIKSENTLRSILESKSYKDYILSYKKLTQDQKNQLASLLSNK